ncbi:hypothetical protein [Kribbella sp. DT2]|uniref:YncE family protein n=1 Tax=Kribbella sp. DT2 TaxID=3393427 RepID=UPI003CF69AEC
MTGRRTLAALGVMMLALGGCSGQAGKGDTSAEQTATAKPAPKLGEPIPIEHEVWSVAITPDSRFAYVANPESLTIVELASRKVETIPFLSEGGKQVRFSRDGKQAYLAGNYTSGAVRFIDTATRAETATVDVDSGPLSDLAVAPDGRHLYAVSAFPGLVRIDVRRQVVDLTVDLPDAEHEGIAVSPDGRWVYVTSAPAHSGGGPPINALTVVDATSGKVVKTLQLPGDRPDDVVVTPDGKRIFVSYATYETTKPNFVSVLDAGSLAVVAKVPVTGRSYAMAITPDGRQLYVTGMDEKSVADGTPGMDDLKPAIEVIDTTTNAVTSTVPLPSNSRDLEIAPNGHLAVVVDGNTLIPITLG